MLGIEQLKIRRSLGSDKENIEKLLKASFVATDYSEALIEINNRYMVCVNDTTDEIVAITGIYFDKKLEGLKLEWTCTHPKYRDQGIMNELIKSVLSSLDIVNNRKIYCDCWYLMQESDLNIISLINSFGFSCVMKAEKALDKKFKCRYKTICKNYKTIKCKDLTSIINNCNCSI